MDSRYGQDKEWQRIMRGVRDLMGGPSVRFGVFGDGTKAAAHEFGTLTKDGEVHIPERSFIRSTFQKNEAEVQRITGNVSRAFLAGKIHLQQALGILGQWGVARIKQTIVEQDPEWPALAEATLARKGDGKSKTLIDTGELLNSISYEVER